MTNKGNAPSQCGATDCQPGFVVNLLLGNKPKNIYRVFQNGIAIGNQLTRPA